MNKYDHQKVEAKWPSDAKALEGKQKYDFRNVEKKWQDIWDKTKLYKADDESKKPKYYCLDMFPYPSGEGLHVGHWRGYVLSDLIARYQMLNGNNVLHPMGWDAFGLPAENAAIKAKSHPKIFTDKAINNFRKQIKQIGTMIDWSREINTSDPGYYKWTQWLFIQLYKNGLAYRKNAPVNWCSNCQTVLANEQVISGECERCNGTVARKDLTQWFFKITDFAEDLLKDLDNLDWPERTKTLQRNWIGKSFGTSIKFKIKAVSGKRLAESEFIEVFTTRADTLFGCTYVVVSPENDLISKIKDQISNYDEVAKYIYDSKNKTDIDRTEAQKDKTGIKLEGLKAINPINNEEIDVWVADYVLSSYGTGAVMAVPAHDQRDFEFAKKYNIDIKQVVTNNEKNIDIDKNAFIDYGVLINSGEFDGLSSKEAQKKITQKLKNQNLGDFKTNYKLHDWLISRQRYWGTPIPVIYCRKCLEIRNPKSEIRNNTTIIDGKEYAIIPVLEEDLPVLLPQDVEFTPHGDSPLKQSESFVNISCPKCGGKAKRETDTMDTFVDSSWYYIAYAQNQISNIQKDNNIFNIDTNKLNRWLPVDFYVGGVEHAILHLLYARFISKALHKLKIVDYSPAGEPFYKLYNIGMIYLHGAKMSKSKGNIVSPDDLIIKYGTDALRGYELFVGPADQDAEWQINGITGITRFIDKIWQFYSQSFTHNDKKDAYIEKQIKVVTDEINGLRPNTALSNLMKLFNYLSKTQNLSIEYANKINILLAPFFPHLAEELWHNAGNTESIFKTTWPDHDKELINYKVVKIPVSINGKVKKIIEIDKNLTKDEAKDIALSDKTISDYLIGKKIDKIVYVAGRICNIVIK